MESVLDDVAPVALEGAYYHSDLQNKFETHSSYFLEHAGFLSKEIRDDLQKIDPKALQMYRPIMYLQGMRNQNSNEYKKGDNFLQTTIKESVEYKGESLKGEITQIDAFLENAKKLSITFRVLQDRGTEEERKCMLDLEADAKGTCLAINKFSKEIFVGCEDGNIHIYKCANRLFTYATKLTKQHQKALVALKVHFGDAGLISKSQDSEIYIWNLLNLTPYLKIGKTAHGKDYLFERAIVQSHVFKSNVSSFLDADAIYTIPLSWLRGNPGLNLSQHCYAYHVEKLAQLKKPCTTGLAGHIEQENNANNNMLNSLYNMPIMHTFEPEVTAAFKKHIELRAAELGCKVQDTTFAKP
jgi:hypothetical protein